MVRRAASPALRWAMSLTASLLAASTALAFVPCPTSGGSSSGGGGGGSSSSSSGHSTSFPRGITESPAASPTSPTVAATAAFRHRLGHRIRASRRRSACGRLAVGEAISSSPSMGDRERKQRTRLSMFPGAAAATATVAGASPPSARSRGHHRERCGGLAMTSQEQQQQLEAEEVSGEHAYEVVFVRHGQSTWNKANRFIGWTDAELTEEGEIEARVAGQLLLSEGFEFDVVYTSMLKRAIKTAWVVLDELNQQHVPVITDWHLNERCYGALVGREKKECVRSFGAEQVKAWRRSWDIPPPPIDKSSKLWPGNNPKYKFLMKDGESQVPLHESLKDVMARSSVYWDEVIAPAVRSGKRVCICGHENNLRSLLKYVDSISDADIMHVELPRAVPLVYRLDKNLRPIGLAGSAPHLSGGYVGDADEIAAIQERDLKNVYDLSVSDNLEEVGAPRFAARLDALGKPCDVDDYGAPVGEGGAGDFTGSFLETGVGEEDCRTPEISSKPLLLYNRGGGQTKPAAAGEAPEKAPSTSTNPSSSSSSNNGENSEGDNVAVAAAAAPPIQAPAFVPVAEQTS